MLDVKESSLWANRKCLLICCIVSIANMQYGFDTAAVGGMQGMQSFKTFVYYLVLHLADCAIAMPGFLKVFGYPNPKSPIGYGIDVRGSKNL